MLDINLVALEILLDTIHLIVDPIQAYVVQIWSQTPKVSTLAPGQLYNGELRVRSINTGCGEVSISEDGTWKAVDNECTSL